METPGSFPSSSAEIDTLLFDLDGTLVDITWRGLELVFMLRAIRRFRGAIAPWKFYFAFWDAVKTSKRHMTDRTNHQVLLETLHAHSTTTLDDITSRVHAYIDEDFAKLAGYFSPIPGARETILLARDLGYRVVVATNPSMPYQTVRLRLDRAGVGDIDFDYITHSENSTRCKPSLEYYRELLGAIGARPAQCLMIGNDIEKDLPAREIGILTYMLDTPHVHRQIKSLAAVQRLQGCGDYVRLQGWLRASGPRRTREAPSP
ncbi:MAG TPA: HAD family hydrolase [Spirochaetota bacterium]|nr:HAD family hydrolase [Spirochaetota bacterium]HNT10598.1 HAD family hydrolase [Spirochaetota bacterium]